MNELVFFLFILERRGDAYVPRGDLRHAYGVRVHALHARAHHAYGVRRAFRENDVLRDGGGACAHAHEIHDANIQANIPYIRMAKILHK